MNIEQAKEQIKNAMLAYFEKDDFGEYVIAEEEQRPIFLVGPSGIGKTAIMKRIALELGVGFISYSMTHHTRQSALGLPFIEKKVYNFVIYYLAMEYVTWTAFYRKESLQWQGICCLGIYNVRNYCKHI